MSIEDDGEVFLFHSNSEGNKLASYSAPAIRQPDKGGNGSNKPVRPHSLSVPASPNGVVTFALTDSDDDCTGQCFCMEHEGTQILDETFDLSVDQVFDLIFSEDSVFYSDFIKTRKTFGLNQSPWPGEPDADGNKTRTISYILSLNYSIGPKTSYTTEKQTWYSNSKPGYSYVIDADIFHEGVPYSDSFHTVNRYCLTRVNGNRCRLRINTDVKYKKGLWGFMKNLIEKTAYQGVQDNFQVMAAELHLEAEKLVQLVSGNKPRKKVQAWHPSQRIQKNGSLPLDESTPEESFNSPQIFTSKDEWHVTLKTDSLLKVVIAVLILLVMFNAVLFYTLFSMEEKAAKRNPIHHDILAHLQQPKSHDEWVKLLNEQRQLQEREIVRWKEILSASVHLMDQMKQTLVSLQQSIDERSKYFTNADTHKGQEE